MREKQLHHERAAALREKIAARDARRREQARLDAERVEAKGVTAEERCSSHLLAAQRCEAEGEAGRAAARAYYLLILRVAPGTSVAEEAARALDRLRAG